MNKKIVRVLGKRGRITIPYQIRVRNKIGYNDILSFEEKDANTIILRSISYLFKKCIEIAILTAFSILPLLAVAAAGKNYILPVCVTLVYTFLSFILLMVNMYLHPLSSATAIIMRDIPGVILAQEVNIPAALFCIGIWTIVSIVFAYISLKHRK